MKIVHSLWSKPWENLGVKGVRQSWLTPAHYWASWAYSARTSFAKYGKIDLVTDKLGALILSDTLQLPYNKVSVVLDKMAVNPALWTAGKITAYGMQTEPFLHIDSDAYFLKKLPQRFLDAGIVAQYEENERTAWSDGYLDGRTRLNSFPKKPTGWTEYKDDNVAVCMGIFGGTDLDSISNFSREIWKIITQTSNSSKWIETGESARGMNITLEQQAAYCYFRKTEKTVTYLVDEADWANKHAIANEIGFVHLMSRRRQQSVNNRLMERISNEYPDDLARIWKMLA